MLFGRYAYYTPIRMHKKSNRKMKTSRVECTNDWTKKTGI